MPHTGKKFASRPVDGRSSSSRGTSWSKYGSAPTADVHEGIPSEIVVEVDGMTVVPSTDTSTRYDDRPSSAPLPPPAESALAAAAEKRSEWVSTRSVDGRTYRRRDELITTIA